MFRGLQAHLKRASNNLAKEKTHVRSRMTEAGEVAGSGQENRRRSQEGELTIEGAEGGIAVEEKGGGNQVEAEVR